VIKPSKALEIPTAQSLEAKGSCHAEGAQVVASADWLEFTCFRALLGEAPRQIQLHPFSASSSCLSLLVNYGKQYAMP